MREVNVPPTIAFAVLSSMRSPARLDGISWPTSSVVCCAPGRSSRYTRAAEAGAVSGIDGLVSATPGSGDQSPKCRSSIGTTWPGVTAPVTMIVTLSGRSTWRWKSSRSWRVNAAIDASVPEPENGIAYGWPSP